MMEIHHFLTFPSWWIEGISYPTAEKLSVYICRPMKLCVPIFCFLTGYFYFFNKNKTLKYSIRKISDLLITYWICFFMMAVIASIFAKYRYDIISVLLESLGLLYRPTMRFCWYVHFYIAFMLLLPYITKIMSKNMYLDLFVSLILINVFIKTIIIFDPFDNLINECILEVLNSLYTWIPNVLIGYIFASYDLFDKIYKLNIKTVSNKTIRIILWIVMSFLSFVGRFLLQSVGPCFFRISLDAIYASIYIYSVACIYKEINIKPINKLLVCLGQYSLSMWFISCIFFNNCQEIFQPVLYLPKNEILVLLWGTILCLVPAIFIDKLSKLLQKKKNAFLS